MHVKTCLLCVQLQNAHYSFLSFATILRTLACPNHFYTRQASISLVVVSRWNSVFSCGANYQCKLFLGLVKTFLTEILIFLLASHWPLHNAPCLDSFLETFSIRINSRALQSLLMISRYTTVSNFPWLTLLAIIILQHGMIVGTVLKSIMFVSQFLLFCPFFSVFDCINKIATARFCPKA